MWRDNCCEDSCEDSCNGGCDDGCDGVNEIVYEIKLNWIYCYCVRNGINSISKLYVYYLLSDVKNTLIHCVPTVKRSIGSRQYWIFEDRVSVSHRRSFHWEVSRDRLSGSYYALPVWRLIRYVLYVYYLFNNDDDVGIDIRIWEPFGNTLFFAQHCHHCCLSVQLLKYRFPICTVSS